MPLDSRVNRRAAKDAKKSQSRNDEKFSMRKAGKQEISLCFQPSCLPAFLIKIRKAPVFLCAFSASFAPLRLPHPLNELINPVKKRPRAVKKSTFTSKKRPHTSEKSPPTSKKRPRAVKKRPPQPRNPLAHLRNDHAHPRNTLRSQEITPHTRKTTSPIQFLTEIIAINRPRPQSLEDDLTNFYQENNTPPAFYPRQPPTGSLVLPM